MTPDEQQRIFAKAIEQLLKLSRDDKAFLRQLPHLPGVAMNPLVQALLSALVKQLEAHPEQLQALADAAIKWLIAELAKANAS